MERIILPNTLFDTFLMSFLDLFEIFFVLDFSSCWVCQEESVLDITSWMLLWDEESVEVPE